MTLLDKKDYPKVIVPLSSVGINHFFARAIVERKIEGQIFVDHPDNPKTFYIVHPYGISLLFGDCNNNNFNNDFKNYALNVNRIRNKYEWMQAFSDDWHPVLNELFKGYIIKSSENKNDTNSNFIELNTRVNFKFNPTKYLEYKKITTLDEIKILRTDATIFEMMKGTVVPSGFWNSAEDFHKNGIGFSVFYQDKLASTAYSAFIFEDKLELGIETVAEFRGKGLAEKSCSALIDYCIENGFEPIWSCKYENTASLKLAQKLGFEPTKFIPFYRLIIFSG